MMCQGLWKRCSNTFVMLRATIFTYFKGCEMHSSSRFPWAPHHLNTRTFLPVTPEQIHLPVTHMFLSPESLYLHSLQARQMHWIGVLTYLEKWCSFFLFYFLAASHGTRDLCSPAGGWTSVPLVEVWSRNRWAAKEVAAVLSRSHHVLLVAVSFSSWEKSSVIDLKNEYCHHGEMNSFQILFLRKSLVDILFSQ